MSASAVPASSVVPIHFKFPSPQKSGEDCIKLEIDTKDFPHIYLQQEQPLNHVFSLIKDADLKALDRISAIFFSLKFMALARSPAENFMRQLDTALDFIKGRQEFLKMGILTTQALAVSAQASAMSQQAFATDKLAGGVCNRPFRC